MRLFLQIISLVLLAKYTIQICQFPDPEWCYSISDPFIKGFDTAKNDYENYINFDAKVNNIMFYADDRYPDEVLITGSFLKCNIGCRLTCNCGFHFRAKDTLVFIDSCGLSNLTGNAQINIKTQLYASYPGEPLSQVDCTVKTVKKTDMTNDDWWKMPGNAININDEILCARVFGSRMVVLRTNYFHDSLNVYANLIPGQKVGLAEVQIRAAPHAYLHTKGLCGKWNNNMEDDDPYLYLTVNGTYIFQGAEGSEDETVAFQSSPIGADQPYCCDDDNNADNCETTLIECVYKYLNQPGLFNSDVLYGASQNGNYDEESAAAACDQILVPQLVKDLYDALGQEYTDIYDSIYFRICVNALMERAAEDVVNDIRSCIIEPKRAELCEISNNPICE